MKTMFRSFPVLFVATVALTLSACSGYPSGKNANNLDPSAPGVEKTTPAPSVGSVNNVAANLIALKKTNACPGCYLMNVNLAGANLAGANLKWANFRHADLTAADLRGADLEGALLKGANLKGADLQGANLRGAIMDSFGYAVAKASQARGFEEPKSKIVLTPDQRFAQAQVTYNKGQRPAALKVWKRLAYQGYIKAQYKLGLLYDFGRGVPKDSKKALKWFRVAAEKGNVEAQYMLGVMYFNGRGVARDFDYSARWLKMAARQGNADARNYLIRVERARSDLSQSNSPLMSLEGKPEAAAAQPAPIRDTTAPVIDIDIFISVESDNPTIQGRVTDNDNVALLTVDGARIEIHEDGNFSFTRFVPPTGTAVLIRAVDQAGNRSTKTIRLTR